MKNPISRRNVLVVLALGVVISFQAQAELFNRGGGLIYDDVNDITWLQDTNFARTSGFDSDGAMTWVEAMAWVETLTYYDSIRDVNLSGWRLPITVQPDPSCSLHINGNDLGEFCVGSEMGKLYYVHGISRDRPGPFVNLSNNYAYWSSTLTPPSLGTAWQFYFATWRGWQNGNHKNNQYYPAFAWPVRDGDVASPPNEPPIAIAGTDQSVRATDLVTLDGSASYDDNTVSTGLLYSWRFSSLPPGSTTTIIGADTATPTFIVDLADTYVIELVVTDEGGLSSIPDEVVVGADNLAPTPVAGNDQLVIVGTTVNLDGSASTDPEFDPLTYAWAITAAPVGSSSTLTSASSVNPSFVTDLAGIYLVNLAVSDFIGSSAPDTVQVTAASVEDFAEYQIILTDNLVEALSPGQVTTGGNQNAFLNFLSQAIVAILEGDLAEAIDKLEKGLKRTDGCVLRGLPDGNGPGRDWITDCTAQIETYGLLSAALAAITP